MIRRATAEDIPHIIDLAVRLYDAIEIDPDHFGKWLSEAIHNNAFWIGVSETGTFGLAVAPFYANGKTVFTELWVCDAGGRARDLIKEMERLSAGGELFVRSIIAQRGETLAKWYERRGYTRTEIGLSKEF